MALRTLSTWQASATVFVALRLFLTVESLSPQHPLLNLSNLETLEAFEAATGYSYTLTEEYLRPGVYHRGLDNRLRRFLLKWLAGEQVKVGVVGGSVSYGSRASKIGETDWFSILVRFFQSAHKTANASGRNGALSATGSTYMNLCLDNHVDQDTDLLVVDYSINDFYSPKPLEQTTTVVYEQLIRKALSRPNSPSILPVMFLHCFYKHSNRTHLANYYNTMEDMYTIVSMYYGLPWISIRNALWHQVCLYQPGLDPETVYEDVYMHPNDYGQRVYVDYFIYMIQQSLLDIALDVHRGPAQPRSIKRPAEALAPPGASTPSGTSEYGMKAQPGSLAGVSETEITPFPNEALSGTRLHALEEKVFNTPPLMDPMLPSNFHQQSLLCVTAEQLGDVVESAQGFVYGMETSGARMYAFHKWGWIANTTGSKLVLKVNTQPAPELNVPADVPVNLYFGYLKSYNHMGTARLICISGCECEDTLIDAHHNISASQTYTTSIGVTQHPECRMLLEVLNVTSSGEHKFKFTSLMIAERKRSSLNSFVDGFGR